jgi:hypothetical protein
MAVLGGLSAIAIVLAGSAAQWSVLKSFRTSDVAVAQVPAAAPRTAPTAAPGVKVTPRTTPTPAAPAPALPTSPANQTTIPAVPVSPSLVAPPPAPPASTAAPLPLGGTYQDPSGRFKVGVLKDFKVSPLAGSVLIESPDGNLAYSVVTQSQPLGTPIGLSAGYDNSESLAKIARSVFQRGEGFQPGPPRSEAGGGAVLDWTGTLTIAGTSQPVGGTILVRPTPRDILLLIVTATQAGAKDLPGALSALASNLQS